MQSIIICEDDSTQLSQLTTMVKNYVLFHNESFNLGLSTTTPQACLAYLTKQQLQNGIYLLDIDLQATMDGIELAKRIRQLDVQAKLIFITTHDELAPLTLKYQLEVLGFISKDQSVANMHDELIENLTLARSRSVAAAKTAHRNFSFSMGSRIYNLPLSECLFLEPDQLPHRLKLHTTTGEYEFYGKLNTISQQYPQLFRCAKSALINVQNVRQYDVKTKLIYFDRSLSCKCSITKTKELKRRLHVEG
ncbi:DNA-binding response regulator [Lactobacillus sp.] [Lactiplantibacillus mudanjiangensis]|uniref:LytR/AlgR family response regulator transcription factor n=1 Tax=Lactiplantibacillus mudanjiangensis TaxID=1296538 RepID=UPI001015BAD4|nr:DNA-binding response regulator [Lactobacillus sp.] [Lactiplantibacillus mudanjiangensis]